MVQLTKKNKGSSYKRVRLTFEFLARNPTPQYSVTHSALEEMLNIRMKDWMEFHRMEGDPNTSVLMNMFGTDFLMDTAAKTGILHPSWYPNGAFNNVYIRVEELDNKGNNIAKKPKLFYRVLSFFRGIG